MDKRTNEWMIKSLPAFYRTSSPSVRCPKSSNEVESERADFSPERTGFSSERANFRPERADSRSKRAYIGPEKANFRPERAWGEEVTKERTVVSTKVPHVPQDFVPLGVAAQKPEG